jgi:hypothetical protein
MRKNIIYLILFGISVLVFSGCAAKKSGVYLQNSFNAEAYEAGAAAYIGIGQMASAGDISKVFVLSILEFTNEKGEKILLQQFGNESYLIPPGHYKLTQFTLHGSRLVLNMPMSIFGTYDLDLTGLFDAGFSVKAGDAVYLGFIMVNGIDIQKTDKDKKSQQYYVSANINVISSTQAAYYFSLQVGKQVVVSPIKFIKNVSRIEKTINSKFTLKASKK